jgi:flagellar protein FliS
MFTTAKRAIGAYTKVGIETGVETADPHKLVLMLYDGALYALIDAKRHMALRDVAAKGKAISKAIAILEDGLLASLDVKAGGTLGEHLAALYDYMCRRLLMANLHNRPELLDEVSALLGELRGAWAQIRPLVDVPQSQNQTAAVSPATSYRKA